MEIDRDRARALQPTRAKTCMVKSRERKIQDGLPRQVSGGSARLKNWRQVRVRWTRPALRTPYSLSSPANFLEERKNSG